MTESIPGRPEYTKGMVYKVHAVNNKEGFFEFDGNKLHYVLPFQGHRASLVYYVCAEYAKVV